ncbi:CDP-diacylglycerol--glycerol-3-phosphate 3-phosphatidyltransferase [Mycoplasma anatis]|uniref:CDP-diacylglycerol--glycerol-3-phosphate 3-phosphatidyltransferase n=1 Tax=Mycoplasmopsis anatis TaxID=171279 RepID=A0A9Q3L8Q3_9BACT|nr:CDP-diacylglycerol--glycerol-3-phosphate 3-phosphatidyltransferase [Mycoplasmopsis anatis]MBW0596429.1 CDP-diacylglycerol--glycerol-3-phosphate 3-phosphatidyltransferase [Mycoplasmopsis anatis]MBW0597149.1 CDP-diacylglycerol--glycerol-3-phosphate 3-phosphatidyltransferase [Mycoplasmopsis anatis]MBW0597886.1 CDP-diacylglycerol--glycerol-3-phosphate 3-phosphatidyltransferase [Mycoplasmopsis anatis]MBW0600084.1 CDP-diacylglycerol--glycerol-3-phosphate 3-phosphatidyltransferase [Mycoplasmopsis a
MKTNYLNKFNELNLPNKLTVIRLFLSVPLFIFSLLAFLMNILANKYVPNLNDLYKIALVVFLLFILIIFIVAMITDFFDGKIAREKNLVSDFGKLWDPIADKMITTISLLLLLGLKAIPLFVVIIFLARDLVVAGCRTILAKNNVSVEANINGKIKTVLMSVGIVIMFIFLIAYNIKTSPIETNYETFVYCLSIPLMIAAIFNVISGYQYISAAIKFMK